MSPPYSYCGGAAITTLKLPTPEPTSLMHSPHSCSEHRTESGTEKKKKQPCNDGIEPLIKKYSGTNCSIQVYRIEMEACTFTKE